MCNQNCNQGRACDCEVGLGDEPEILEPLTTGEKVVLVFIAVPSAAVSVLGVVWLLERAAELLGV